MLLHKCRNVAPRHGWVVLGSHSLSWLLCEKMGHHIDRIGLAMSMSPSPGHYRMNTLLKATLNKPSKISAQTWMTQFFGLLCLSRGPFGQFAGR